MPHLSLSFFGPFKATLDGQIAGPFKSNKVRALLAFLAVEADKPHSRETLASLLWPDWPDRDALANLRYALSDLRSAIGDRRAQPPFLLISRSDLQFNQNSDCQIDVASFLELAATNQTVEDAVEHWQHALALNRGPFLEGFSLEDSPAFDDWVGLTRDALSRQIVNLHLQLAQAFERLADYENVQKWLLGLIELEPWNEEAHRQLMRALALTGRRSAALTQFETCRRILAEQLDVPPSHDTLRLYEQIRNGALPQLQPPEPPVSVTPPQPRFLLETEDLTESPTFVARAHELAQLDLWFHRALTGQGQVTFVVGEAGVGKSALLHEFARRSQRNHPNLLIAHGNCNAFTGIGDPYLPFREILELLTGDIDARLAAGAITPDRAQRLWRALPLAAEALIDFGPDLIGTFVLRTALLDRIDARAQASGSSAQLDRLQGVLEREFMPDPSRSHPRQSALFEQYSKVLHAIALEWPLILILDDLQWADVGSISLLFHLGRRLTGSPILVCGAYRPEEIINHRDGTRHELEALVNEFRRDFGDITIDLNMADSREFVQALLDSEPNRLDSTFSDMLYQQTDGHPLFTLELLRGLQERRNLVKDEQGCWIIGPELNWETLPARVEAVIAERIGRLDPRSRAILRAASAEGETFTSEIIAEIEDLDDRELLSSLSRDLDRKHRLIHALSISQANGRLVSRYRFRHFLFHKYLYGTLDEVERVHLHAQIGAALEELYDCCDQEAPTADLALQLARHFEEGKNAAKAIRYLHQAGDRAVELSAYPEGISHLTRALDLLMTQPATTERLHRELELQLSLGRASIQQIPNTQWKGVYTRARELCYQLDRTSELCMALGELAIHHYVRGEYATALILFQEARDLALQTDDPLLWIIGNWYLGLVLFCTGNPVAALEQFQRATTLYVPELHHDALISLRGSDAGTSALAYECCCLWTLGYPDQAAERSQRVLTIARELGHAFSLIDVVCFAGCLLHAMARNASPLREYAQEMVQLARGMAFEGWSGTGEWHLGDAMVLSGEIEAGIQQMRDAMQQREFRDIRINLSGLKGNLAEALGKAGLLQEGLATLEEALALIEETGEDSWKPELHRLRGELLLVMGDASAAEADFGQAIEIARKQQARSWELRAAVSLCRLWRDQGKTIKARTMLAELYGWFTEGFDTKDLVEARNLLDSLLGD